MKVELKLIQDQLIDTYKQIADHTKMECTDNYEGSDYNCKSDCKKPMSCCDPNYCEISIEWAKMHWNVELQEVYTLDFIEGRTKLRFMEDGKGCILAPHLRPLCSLHACPIYNIGFKYGNEDATHWNERYFQLRDKIDELEFQKYEQETE